MSKTFEEVATPELDGLYQGALFLTGGDERGAERLLITSITSAFARHTSGDVDAPLLEDNLVRTFLVTVSHDHPERDRVEVGGSEGKVEALEDLSPAEVFSAAALLPPRGRAAIWLVTFLRRSYADAGRVLRLDRAGVVALLAHNETLRAAVVRAHTTRTRARWTS